MADNILSVNEYINKKDMDLILEVNRKTIEINTTVASQNEEILDELSEIKEQNNKSTQQKKEMEAKIDKLVKQSEDTGKDLFKIQVLFLTGVVSIIIQVIQIFLKK